MNKQETPMLDWLDYRKKLTGRIGQFATLRRRR